MVTKSTKGEIAFRTCGYQKYEREKLPFALVVTKSTNGKNRLSHLWLPKVRKGKIAFRTYGYQKYERGKSPFALNAVTESTKGENLISHLCLYQITYRGYPLMAGHCLLE